MRDETHSWRTMNDSLNIDTRPRLQEEKIYLHEVYRESGLGAGPVPRASIGYIKLKMGYIRNTCLRIQYKFIEWNSKYKFKIAGN